MKFAMKLFTKDNLKRRWILAGLAWTGALLLVLVNSGLINQIMHARAKTYSLQKDAEFLKSHAEGISKVMEDRTGLRHPIETLSLGLLTLEGDLRSLAAAHNLIEVRIESTQDEDPGDRVPVKVSFEGELRKIMEWLEAASKNRPYLIVSGIELEANTPEARAKCNILLHYRYIVSSPEENTEDAQY